MFSFAYCKHFTDSGFSHPIQLDSEMVYLPDMGLD